MFPTPTGYSAPYFASSLSLDQRTAIIGSHGYTGDTGWAHIFRRDEGGADNWGRVAEFTGSGSTPGARFGESVSVNGNTAVVGAPRDEDYGIEVGSAYVFERDPDTGSWRQMAKLNSADGGVGDEFGWSVLVLQNTVIVGAPSAFLGGAAYVFRRDSGGPDHWGEVLKLTG